MVILYTKRNHTCTWKQCVTLHKHIMLRLTGKVCYIVVISVQVFSYLVKNKTIIEQTCAQQYVFMAPGMYHTIICMEDVYTTKNVSNVTEYIINRIS